MVKKKKKNVSAEITVYNWLPFLYVQFLYFPFIDRTANFLDNCYEFSGLKNIYIIGWKFNTFSQH